MRQVHKDRISALQKRMAERGLDGCLIPTSDFHQSEYVGDYFKLRKWLSGFTGSAGTLAVTRDQAALWTDGRYFIQAEQQLEGTGIQLMRQREEGVPELEQWLFDQLPKNGVLGLDGRVISKKTGDKLEKKLAPKGIRLECGEDVAGALWEDRPALSAQPAWLLDLKYCGKSVPDKLADLRKKMEDKAAQVHLLTSLDDIAWLFNLRGGDVECNPVALAYAAVTLEEAFLFINPSILKEEDRKALEANGVTLLPYGEVVSQAKKLCAGKSVLLDPGKVNFAICRALEDANLVEGENPTAHAKAVKNETEMRNTIHGHVLDGVAFTRFMFWLKTHVGKEKITEISASDYLEACRREMEGNLGLSFDTISAYREHAAMMHYSATPETDYEIKPEGMLLVDSGGQYVYGTTDITRTMVLGPVPEEQKRHFTTVVRSMLNLQNARFLHGSRGITLDILARGPLWDLELDYKCGTGHGVGYLLNVHEGPNNFYWNCEGNRGMGCVFEEGMITTDEPGVYVEGSHGIRIENELLCRKGPKNEYGQFLYFQPLTVAPIDLDGIDPQWMSSEDLVRLNRYHNYVYDTLAPYLSTEEREWLERATAPVR